MTTGTCMQHGQPCIHSLVIYAHKTVYTYRIPICTWKIMYAHPARYMTYHAERSEACARRDNSYIGLGVGGISSHIYRVFVTAIPH